MGNRARRDPLIQINLNSHAASTDRFLLTSKGFVVSLGISWNALVITVIDGHCCHLPFMAVVHRIRGSLHLKARQTPPSFCDNWSPFFCKLTLVDRNPQVVSQTGPKFCLSECKKSMGLEMLQPKMKETIYEGLMITVVYPPGSSDPIHRHNAHAFVYVLEGSIVMQVRGGKEVTLTPG